MILLTGATGQVGLRLARRLAPRAGVRALARSDSAAAALRELGIDVVRGDLADPATLPPALEGVDTLFLLTPFSPDQAQLEHNALDAGRELRKVAKLSAINRGIAISKAHEEIARRLRESGLQASILHADFFVSNLFTQLDPIRNGQLIYPADGTARRAFVDPEDIAEVAAAELTAEDPVGGDLAITGPESLTFAELAERISAGLGRKVALVDPPANAWRDGLVAAGVPGFYADALVELFERDIKPVGAIAPTPDVRRVLGRPAQSVDRFIRDELAPAL